MPEKTDIDRTALRARATDDLLAALSGPASAADAAWWEDAFAELAGREEARDTLRAWSHREDDGENLFEPPKLGAFLLALASMRPPLAGSIGLLRRLTRDERPEVVADAIDALARLGDVASWPALLARAAHPAPKARAAHLRFLARATPAAALAFLISGLRDPSPLVRENAVDELHELGQPDLASLLANLTDDPDERVREAAWYAIEHEPAGHDLGPVASHLRATLTRGLLTEWAALMRELRRREVTRTNNNPVGDIAEALVAAHYEGIRGSFVQAGWDVMTPDGEKLQVKALRRTPDTKRRNLSHIRDTDYDAVVVVVFDEWFRVDAAFRLDRATVEERFAHNKHVNGRIVTVTEKLLADPAVEHLAVSDAILDDVAA